MNFALMSVPLSVFLSLSALVLTSPSNAQTVKSTTPAGATGPATAAPGEPGVGQSLPGAPADPQAAGSVSGTIVDPSGAVVGNARIKLNAQNPAQNLDGISGIDGQFFFPQIAPGPFKLTITAAGFATQTITGAVSAGQVETLPPIALSVADAGTEVEVGLPQIEVAEEEIKVEEKQRVLGVLPNFYVSYVPDAAPLTPKQKFELAWRSLIDPFTLVMVAGAAGVEQAQNHFAEYGQGAQGYGKRFGANYADAVTGTLIGGAILPSLLKQDPRYFYKGTGSVPARALYAIANAFICKGDNKRWQPNYSGVLGSLAAGGISNLYYPKQDRDDASLTFENTAIGIGATAISNLLQEFVIRKLTPKAKGSNTSHR